jgi:CTP synthase
VASIPVDGSGQTPDVCLVELGGTVGDIEGMIFLEALRQLRFKVGSENFCLVHVSLVPVVGATGEPKAKPTYHSVRELRTVGLHPDIIVCRRCRRSPLPARLALCPFSPRRPHAAPSRSTAR